MDQHTKLYSAALFFWALVSACSHSPLVLPQENTLPVHEEIPSETDERFVYVPLQSSYSVMEGNKLLTINSDPASSVWQKIQALYMTEKWVRLPRAGLCQTVTILSDSLDIERYFNSSSEEEPEGNSCYFLTKNLQVTPEVKLTPAWQGAYFFGLGHSLTVSFSENLFGLDPQTHRTYTLDLMLRSQGKISEETPSLSPEEANSFLTSFSSVWLEELELKPASKATTSLSIISYEINLGSRTPPLGRILQGSSLNIEKVLLPQPTGHYLTSLLFHHLTPLHNSQPLDPHTFYLVHTENPILVLSSSSIPRLIGVQSSPNALIPEIEFTLEQIEEREVYTFLRLWKEERVPHLKLRSLVLQGITFTAEQGISMLNLDNQYLQTEPLEIIQVPTVSTIDTVIIGQWLEGTSSPLRLSLPKSYVNAQKYPSGVQFLCIGNVDDTIFQREKTQGHTLYGMGFLLSGEANRISSEFPLNRHDLNVYNTSLVMELRVASLLSWQEIFPNYGLLGNVLWLYTASSLESNKDLNSLTSLKFFDPFTHEPLLTLIMENNSAFYQELPYTKSPREYAVSPELLREELFFVTPHLRDLPYRQGVFLFIGAQEQTVEVDYRRLNNTSTAHQVMTFYGLGWPTIHFINSQHQSPNIILHGNNRRLPLWGHSLGVRLILPLFTKPTATLKNFYLNDGLFKSYQDTILHIKATAQSSPSRQTNYEDKDHNSKLILEEGPGYLLDFPIFSTPEGTLLPFHCTPLHLLTTTASRVPNGINDVPRSSKGCTLLLQPLTEQDNFVYYLGRTPVFYGRGYPIALSKVQQGIFDYGLFSPSAANPLYIIIDTPLIPKLDNTQCRLISPSERGTLFLNTGTQHLTGEALQEILTVCQTSNNGLVISLQVDSTY